MTPAAEFNIWADPEAAQRVFHSGIDVTMIGLDVTHSALLTPTWAERFREAGRVGTFVAELVEFFKQYHARTYGWDGAPIHDAVALAHAFRPGIVTTERMNVEVETRVGAHAAAARSPTAGTAPTASRTPTWGSTSTRTRSSSSCSSGSRPSGDRRRGDRAARDAGVRARPDARRARGDRAPVRRRRAGDDRRRDAAQRPRRGPLRRRRRRYGRRLARGVGRAGADARAAGRPPPCRSAPRRGRGASGRDGLLRRQRPGDRRRADGLGDADPALVPAGASRARRQPGARPPARRARGARQGDCRREPRAPHRSRRERRPRPRPRLRTDRTASTRRRRSTTSSRSSSCAGTGSTSSTARRAGRAREGGQPLAARRAHGALGRSFDVELLSYEAPTYFGMLCAAYAPAA